MKSTTQHNRMYTKQDIKVVIELWETSNTAEIAKELDITSQQVQYLAGQIRKFGYKLTRKTVRGYMGTLVKEVMGELHK